MAELKPCPFCGGTEITAEVSYITKEFRIYCVNADEPCVAEMRLSFADAGLGNGEIIDFGEMTEIIQQLVDLWNARTSKEIGADDMGRYDHYTDTFIKERGEE